MARNAARKMTASSWDDMFQTAQAELEDMRKVAGAEDADDKQRALIGQKRALQYLQGSWEIMMELGSSMIGVILAAVGPDYFEVLFEGWWNQADEREDDEDWFWKEIADHLNAGKPVSTMLASVFAMIPEMKRKQRQLWQDGLRTAYCLIKEDEQFRQHLTAQEEKSEKEEKVAEKASPKSATLMLREAEKGLATFRVPVADAARALALLPIPSRALAIASTYIDVMDKALTGEVEIQAEHIGRRLEKVLEETGQSQTDVLQAMIESGDVDVVLAMVRGNVGDYSSTAEHLTVSLCRTIFETDPDMNAAMNSDGNGSARRASRLVNIAHTLLVETDAARTPDITRFFSSKTGKSLLTEIGRLASDGDDDAVTILTAAKDREIATPESFPDSDDESDEE